MEQVEKDLGQNYVYKKASILMYGKLFIEQREFKQMTLMQKINLSFICPDHEFKSKLCQLVYEQLSSLFNFNEELSRMH